MAIYFKFLTNRSDDSFDFCTPSFTKRTARAQVKTNILMTNYCEGLFLRSVQIAFQNVFFSKHSFVYKSIFG